MKRSKAALYPVMVLTMLALGLVVLSASYVHPSPRDDYPNSVWDHFGEKLALLSQRSSGRYLHNLLLPLCPMHWHAIAAYRLVITVLFLGFALSFVAFFFRLFQSHLPLSRPRAASVTLLSLLVFVNNMNSITEAFFWFTGAVAYVLPAIMLLVLGRLILGITLEQRSAPARLQYLVSILLVAGIIGCDEILMLGCDALCCVLFVIAPRKLRYYFGCLLAAAIVCSAIAAFAPGNFVRKESYHGPAFPWLQQWMAFGPRVIAQWIINPYFICYSFLLLAAFSKAGIAISRRRLLFSLLLPVVTVYALSLPAFVSLYFGPPPRVRNILFLCFQASWLNLLYCVSAVLRQRWIGAWNKYQTIKYAVIALLITLSVKFGDLRAANFYRLARGISTGAFEKGDQEVWLRYSWIGASTQNDVAVPPLSYDPDNILMLDEIPDRPDPRCLTTGKLFNKRSIYLSHGK